MRKTPTQSQVIRNFIINNLSNNTTEITQLTCKKFNITRQAVHKHLQALIKADILEAKGHTRNKNYFLKLTKVLDETLLVAGLQEYTVWQKKVEPCLLQHFPLLSKNVIDICHYGFTEILNNAIDHSNSKRVIIKIHLSVNTIHIIIFDNGIGIFNKIREAFDLLDAQQAALELVKGKLTTDPKNHTGEGIFFSSKLFDQFIIISNHLSFFSENNKNCLVENNQSKPGTFIEMKINIKSKKTLNKVFSQFSSGPDDYAFVKTYIPVKFVQHQDETLISRSQAKRLLNHIERFQEVVLDFSDIKQIGQGFADQIFRVFQNEHPKIKINVINSNRLVEQMISRAKANL